MALQDKYKALIDAAASEKISNLQVTEQEGVLHIDGTAPNGNAKDNMWAKYGEIDPTFAGGDLVMNITVAADASVTKAKVVTESTSLNIRKGPGTDQPIVGKAAHGEMVDIVSRTNDQWWLVRSVDGEEGYAYAQYLSAE
jgi:hypothetical protein